MISAGRRIQGGTVRYFAGLGSGSPLRGRWAGGGDRSCRIAALREGWQSRRSPIGGAHRTRTGPAWPIPNCVGAAAWLAPSTRNAKQWRARQWQGLQGLRYGQRIKNRSFPFGGPGSVLMRWKCLSIQQPAASGQRPIRAVVARQARHWAFRGRPIGRARPSFCA